MDVINQRDHGNSLFKGMNAARKYKGFLEQYYRQVLRAVLGCARIALWAVLLFIGNTAKSEFPQDFSKCLNYSNTPQDIKLFRLSLSGNQCFINGQAGSGWIYYEGSFQSNTFYVKSLTNSVQGSGPLRSGSVAGQSYSMNWDVDIISGGSASFSERLSKKNSPLEDRPQAIVSSILQIINQNFKMGILSLKPGTLIWNSSSDFVGESENSEGVSGKLIGRVIEWSNSHPKLLEYKVESLPGRKFVVRYWYSDTGNRPRDIPCEIVCEGFAGEKSVMLITNLIEELEFGNIQVGLFGFDYTQFTNSATIYPILYENGGIYAFHSGKKALIQSGDLSQRVGSPRWKMVLLVMALINIPLIIWLLRISHNNKKNKKST